MMPEYIYRPPQRPHSFGPTPLASSHYRDRAELSESRFGGGGGGRCRCQTFRKASIPLGLNTYDFFFRLELIKKQAKAFCCVIYAKVTPKQNTSGHRLGSYGR